MEIIAQIVVGVVVGAVAARLHLALAKRAAKAATDSARVTTVLLGLPARVGLPAVLLFVLALWGAHALIAGGLAFAVTHRLGTRQHREGATS